MPVFKWTMIREPVNRTMSEFYHMMTKYPALRIFNNSALAKVDFLLWRTHFEFNYIRPSINSTMDDVISAWDFLGVTELIDESMVVLARMLRVPLTDMLYIATK